MKTITEILKSHVTLDIESLDRIYLNGYIPSLQTSKGIQRFLDNHLKNPVASPAILSHITKDFVKKVEQFASENDIPIVPFEKKQRKDDVAQKLRQERNVRDSVVFIGTAQEKAYAFKGRKVGPYDFEYSRQSVFVKHYYFYLDDDDFGPAFIKICTYAPYPIRVYVNGHEWAKRQLEKRNISYQSLDNGFLACEAPQALQEICDQFGPKDIEDFFYKWTERLPFPLTKDNWCAGYLHQLSIWQLEFSKTQVFTQPLRGREFFENVIRENLDMGRPERVQLLFDRKIMKTTPGKFLTRVITSGVHPSIHIQYKSTDIKQYFKENRALRTETTIKNAADFGARKHVSNLHHLRSIAKNINHRLLDAERLSEDCALSEESVERLTQPTMTDDGQRAPAVKLGDPRVMALFAGLTLFLHLPDGFRNRQLRTHVADLLGVDQDTYSARQMSYDLRRLRLKGVIWRESKSTRYHLTTYGYRAAIFFTRLNARLLRPGFNAIDQHTIAPVPSKLQKAFDKVNAELDSIIDHAIPKSA